MEIVKNIGSVMGYIVTAFTLFAAIKTKLFGLLNSHTNRVNEEKERKEQYDELLARLDKLTSQVNDITERMRFSNDASRQLLADAIEKVYRRHAQDKHLDAVEYKKLISAYSIYHNELHGNNYITQLYEEMLGWDHV